MRILFDYSQALTRQCRAISLLLDGKSVSISSERIFTEISKKLEKDFLPPIEREDIAAISFSLLEIESKVKQYYKHTHCKEPLLENQLHAFSDVISGLIQKKKTCGDEIRRLININSKCSQAVEKSAYAGNLNKAIADFLKIAYSAYFKNL